MKIRNLLLIVCLFSFITVVNAKEIYYENENGIDLTREEYDILSEFYWDGYQFSMTEDDYLKFLDLNLLENGVETYYDNEVSLLNTDVTSHNRILKISKSCSGICNISVVATWTTQPKVRSFDVIGAYFSNVIPIGTVDTKIYSNNVLKLSKTTSDYSSKGFGVSIKLPTGGGIVVNQAYAASASGTIYASYQHARSSVTESNSKKYTLSLSGYGSVFKFDSSVSSIYDAAPGVNIKL